MLNIKIDRNKCINALDCLKCIDACRSGVLLVLSPYAEVAKGRIKPVIMSMCTGCGECQRVCPAKAITMIK
ncbi:MAG: hypothetical protein VR69_10010 [Peptococcaceae bacterium BRH_c4b]|nr:MAG: hypothetical protein VR69_10010 [Peptococcaceae bacterium BRH_c4b]